MHDMQLCYNSASSAIHSRSLGNTSLGEFPLETSARWCIPGNHTPELLYRSQPIDRVEQISEELGFES